MLETMQRRVDCSLRQIEGLRALALDRLDDGVAMGWARRQSCQYDQVEVAFEHFSFHTLQRYALPLEQSSLGKGAYPIKVDIRPLHDRLPAYPPRSLLSTSAMSVRSQCSANLPFSMRQISIVLNVKALPVGGMSRIVCV